MGVRGGVGVQSQCGGIRGRDRVHFAGIDARPCEDVKVGCCSF